MEIRPLDKLIAETILTIGQFKQESMGWVRHVTEEDGSTTVVRAYYDGANALCLSLMPTISTYAHHAMKRVSGGVYFEIACKYAEKVGGTIIQKANVMGCSDSGVTEHLLAQYPEQPMMWESVCNGFQEVILGGGLGS